MTQIGVLREIARGQGEVGAEWRARWNASKNTGSPLFGGAICDWNPSQVALAYWFSFYDSVYEHPERPPMKIINNDDLLDQWVEKQSKEMENRAKKNGVGNTHKKGALEHDEMIVFEDADDIYYEDDNFIDADNVDFKYEGVDYDE